MLATSTLSHPHRFIGISPVVSQVVPPSSGSGAYELSDVAGAGLYWWAERLMADFAPHPWTLRVAADGAEYFAPADGREHRLRLTRTHMGPRVSADAAGLLVSAVSLSWNLRHSECLQLGRTISIQLGRIYQMMVEHAEADVLIDVMEEAALMAAL